MGSVIEEVKFPEFQEATMGEFFKEEPVLPTIKRKMLAERTNGPEGKGTLVLGPLQYVLYTPDTPTTRETTSVHFLTTQPSFQLMKILPSPHSVFKSTSSVH